MCSQLRQRMSSAILRSHFEPESILIKCCLWWTRRYRVTVLTESAMSVDPTLNSVGRSQYRTAVASGRDKPTLKIDTSRRPPQQSKSRDGL